jgi:DNA polymerase-1
LAHWTGGEEGLEGLSLSYERGKALFLSGGLIQSCPDLIVSLLNISAEWAVHDLKAFLLLCKYFGWIVKGQCLDTMLMGYLLDPNERDFSLERLGLDYVGQGPGKDEEQGALIADQQPKELSESCEMVLQLSELLLQKIQQAGLEPLLREVEIPLVAVLVQMESDGVRVDTDYLLEMSREIEQDIERLATEVYSLAGQEFNLNSPRQLSFVLFEKLGLPTRKKTGKAGHFSTGVEVLEELAGSYDIARLILEYRELAKLKNTYLDALPKMVRESTGRIHTSYNQMVAATGRLSSSNPNLQNIPIRSELGRRVRRAFVPEGGYKILSADYSQIELRVMAHLSADPVLVDAFRRGDDIHERTAREVFGKSSGLNKYEMRRRAKVINFGIMYGLSAFGLAKSLKIGRTEAQTFIDEYFEKYKGVRKWTETILEEAEAKKIVRTLFGRIRPVPEISSRNRNVREFARRTAINAPIQGTAADLIKIAMVSIFDRLREENLKSRIILQVHDELVFEAEESEIGHLEVLIREEMEGVATLKVPLSVDLAHGDSWYHAK